MKMYKCQQVYDAYFREHQNNNTHALKGLKKMADRPSKNTGSGVKPVPMKLFATWEVEKSSPSCIPRLCSLTLNRLVVNKSLENDLTSVIIAVKMQNSKRVLRSNEIIVPPGGSLDTELDLSFSLQYPHFFKRDVNKLQIMLQRRKKYKNRTILGFKTLALGQVNMSQVLQRCVDRELKLYSDHKERTNVVARISVLMLTSQPVDHEENGHRKQNSSDVDRSPDVDNDTDEDEVHDFNDPESSSNDDLSDGELEEHSRRRPRKVSRGKIRPVTSRQRNLKQRFIALWKRFKVSEDALDSEADHDLIDPDNPAGDIDDLLFDELDDLSDSGPELDTMSVMSTPKPRLRPFFSGRSSSSHDREVPTKVQESGKQAEECLMKRTDSDMNASTMASAMFDVLEHEAEHSDSTNTMSESSPRPRSPLIKSRHFVRERSTSYRETKLKPVYSLTDRRHSAGGMEDMSLSRRMYLKSYVVPPRKVLLDQLSNVLDTGDDKVPESLILVNTAEWQGQLLVQKLQEKQMRLICTCSNADVKAAITFLVAKIQKYCNSNSKTPGPIKLGVAGSDGYINSVMRPYVEQFSTKSPDWQAYTRFLVIPLGVSSIGRHIANIDPTYSSLFMDCLWKDTFERTDSTKLDASEIINRVSKYVTGATHLHQIPIAEAMVMCKGKSSDEAKQIFIPFVSEVKIGTTEVFNMSDLEEGATSPPNLSSSPPSTTTQLIEKTKEGHTPPSSPNIGAMSPSGSQIPSISSMNLGDFVELQVDYWTVVTKTDGVDKDKASKKDTNKCSLKTAFRSLNVSRLPYTGDMTSQTFSMMVVTREKKQKIMRIGKKGKDLESKSQVIEGISRLICTSKSQNFTLKVVVDSVEWTGVKFFQLSSQWQTHIKYFPVAIFGLYDSAL